MNKEPLKVVIECTRYITRNIFLVTYKFVHNLFEMFDNIVNVEHFIFTCSFLVGGGS